MCDISPTKRIAAERIPPVAGTAIGRVQFRIRTLSRSQLLSDSRQTASKIFSAQACGSLNRLQLLCRLDECLSALILLETIEAGDQVLPKNPAVARAQARRQYKLECVF